MCQFRIFYRQGSFFRSEASLNLGQAVARALSLNARRGISHVCVLDGGRTVFDSFDLCALESGPRLVHDAALSLPQGIAA